MRNTLLFLLAIAAMVASCSKENSFEDPNKVPGGADTTGTGGGGTTPNPTGDRLYRIGTKVGTDSITTNYSYTTTGLLERFAQAGTVNGTAISAEVRYVRNAAGIITQNIIKSSVLLQQFGLDSVVARIYYDAANARYTHAVSIIDPTTSPEGDSVVCQYTAGKLSAAIDYYNDGTGYALYSKEEYTYTGANLLQVKTYLYDNGTWELETTATREYDAKTNPASFPRDAPVTSMTLFFSANNETKVTSLDAASGVSQVLTNIYTYTSFNKPATAVSSTDGVVSSQSTYYYR